MSRRIQAPLVALLLLAAACGGGDPAAEESADTDGDGTASTQGSENGSDGEGDQARTLSEFFGWGDGSDPEAQQAQFRDQEARVQEAIRQCMAEQGFEYQPVMPPEEAFSVSEVDEEERVRTQGFGITTYFGNEEEMGMGQEFEDPNQDMLEEMSDSERQAWQEALYGTQEEQEELMETEIDEETGETMMTSTGFGAGCQGEAYEAEFGDQEQTQDLWRELEPQMEEMRQRVEADPRIVELNEEWSACMAEAGYEFESRNDMYDTVFEDFRQRLEEIVGPNMGRSDPFEGWTQEEIEAFFEESTEEEIEAFMSEAEEEARQDVDMEAVEALQQEEIDIAVTDFECAEGWNDTYTEVNSEYEADFIEENRDTLEEIRQAQDG
ncbi:MAG: hypothetical protein ACLFWM_01030 [Actinomycetota bacterium]